VALIAAVAVLLGAGAAVAAIVSSGDEDNGTGAGFGSDVTIVEGTEVDTHPEERQVAPPVEIPPQSEVDLEAAAEAADCELDSPRDEGAQHTEDNVSYKTNPPTSGDHNPVPAQDGVYIESPRVEQLVHSLEHGRIVLQFDRDAPDETKAGLQALYEEDPAHVILTVNATGMPYEVAATAWTQSLTCEDLGPETYDALRAFRDEYRDQGPEFVP
jgi:Protein of unknown function (DUF3105)